MLHKILRFTIATTLCAVFAVGTLHAASFTYSNQAKRIKAGVLLTPGYNVDPDQRPAPYVFYVMDQRQDLKPSGWEFYNPFASSHVTSDIQARWSTKYSAGLIMDKSMGGYWEVSLGEISPEDLAQYDVLYLSGFGSLSWNQREREKLRKFVDNGGVLWIDCQTIGSPLSAQTVLAGPQFIPDVQFSSGGSGMGVYADVPMVARAHALLNRPFTLTATDINLLGGLGDQSLLGKEYNLLTSGSEASNVFMPIILRGGNQIVSAAQYGSGYVVVTACGVGQAITDPVGQANGKCGSMFIAAHPEDLKLAYNIISWGSEHTTPQKNARRTGYSFFEIGAPLVSLWKYEAPASTGTDSATAILDDMVFFVDGNHILHAFDLSPVRDRDLDGNPDDGILDYSKGRPYDELWNYSVGEACSSPTAAYVPVGGGVSVPAVFITTQSGKVMAFKALDFTSSAGPTPSQFFTANPNQLNAFADAKGIPAPTYTDGKLYVGDGWGWLHVHDFYRASGNEWSHPRQGMGSQMGLACAPTVGFAYDPVTGATEEVAYLSTHGASGMADGNIRSYPIRSFNEALRVTTNDGSKLDLKIRSMNTRIDDTQPYHLFYTNNIALPGTAITTNITVQQPGGFEVTDPTVCANVTNGAVVTADYVLAYVNDAVDATNAGYYDTPQFRSIQIAQSTQPGNTPIGMGITGSPAAGKNDVLYFATENNSIYAVKEAGRSGSGFTPLLVKWRWWLGDPKVKALLAPTGDTFTAKNIVGSPVIVGDRVYVVVNSDQGQGYLLAFSADPTFTIKTQYPIHPGTAVTVQQPDLLKDPSGATVNSYSTAADGNGDSRTDTTAFVDYDNGKLTFNNFRARGSANDLTASNDLTINYFPDLPGVPYDASKPASIEAHPTFVNNSIDKWNNLVWAMKLVDPVTGGAMTVSTSPTVMGSILYLGSSHGSLVAVDLDTASQAQGAYAYGVYIKPWNPKYVWTFPAWTTGTTVSTDPVLAPLTGSHGMLAVSTSNGLNIMYNPTTLVADANRLIEVDSQGRTVWSCDSTNGYASTSTVDGSGKASNLLYGSVNVPFNRPAVARRAAVGGTIVADTGNNRIVHIDKGGTAAWQVKDFVEMDPAHPILPPGSSMELNKPMDVSTWLTMEYDIPGDNSSTLRPAYHYLIADSGNSRVLEIVSRYVPAANQYRNVVARVSGSSSEGKTYRFVTARVSSYGSNGAPNAIICAIANENTSQKDVKGLGGALLQFEWYDHPGKPGIGVPAGFINSMPINPLPNQTAQVTLVNPTFFNRQFISNTEYADVVIDAAGIHICDVDPSGARQPLVSSYYATDHVDIDESTGTPLQVPLSATSSVTGPHLRPFAPSYAQYLPSGNVLVTNKATGIAYYLDKSAGGAGVLTPKAFYGEVFEIQPDRNQVGKYVFALGTSTWTNFKMADHADMHQPLSAERLLY